MIERRRAWRGGGGAVDVAERLRPLVRDLPDVPSPGVVFRDISPLLADPDAFLLAVDALAALAPAGGPVDLVAAIEARGFLLGAAVALRLGTGIVPVRKAGKLPWRTLRQAYALEYGTAEVEVHEDAFAHADARSGSDPPRVLVVDDVLATGGTAAATVELVRRGGGDPVGVVVLIELPALGGRRALPGVPVSAVLSL